MKRLAWIFVAAVFAAKPAAADVYFFTPNAAMDLTGLGTALLWTIMRDDTTAPPYTSFATLGLGTPVAGLHLMSFGDWLISFESATDIAGTTWLPQDVVRYDATAGTTSCFFTG